MIEKTSVAILCLFLLFISCKQRSSASTLSSEYYINKKYIHKISTNKSLEILIVKPNIIEFHYKYHNKLSIMSGRFKIRHDSFQPMWLNSNVLITNNFLIKFFFDKTIGITNSITNHIEKIKPLGGYYTSGGLEIKIKNGIHKVRVGPVILVEYFILSNLNGFVVNVEDI